MESSTERARRAPDHTDGAAKAALVVAHPGHELCVYGWLKLNRPAVFVLTDGSAPARPARLGMTTKHLAALGLAPGGFYGVTTDAQVYAALLGGDRQFFADLAGELSRALLEEGVTRVVSDAAEGYNPTHDVLRAVTGAAVARANRGRAGSLIAHYEFAVIQRQDAGAGGDEGAIRLRLDDSTFEEKIGAMRASPELADEVGAGLDGAPLDSLKAAAGAAGEVERIVAALGGAAGFRVEHLRPAEGPALLDLPDGQSPFYERYGEALARRGKYAEVIRYREHYLPVVESLQALNAEARATRA
jgi:hypothetical protein